MIDFRRELKAYGDLAFILGNGINLAAYGNSVSNVKWDDLLKYLWEKELHTSMPNFGGGASLTEIYNIMELHSKRSTLEEEVIRFYREWKPNDFHHKLATSLANDWNVPVMTTNFDLNLHCLEEPYKRHVLHYKNPFDRKARGFANMKGYNWASYYGLSCPVNGDEINYGSFFNQFSLWHINGSVDYKHNIKLGLTQYIAQCQKARSYINRSQYFDDFKGKDQLYWAGINTWLHLIFNKSLCIIGLNMGVDEVFLRWLLIERKFHFGAGRTHNGWFVDKKIDDSKKRFLNEIGFEAIEMDFDDIYENLFSIKK